MSKIELPDGSWIEIVKPGYKKTSTDVYLCREADKTLYWVKMYEKYFSAVGFDDLCEKISEAEEVKKPWHKRLFSW